MYIDIISIWMYMCVLLVFYGKMAGFVHSASLSPSPSLLYLYRSLNRACYSSVRTSMWYLSVCLSIMSSIYLHTYLSNLSIL